MDFRGILIKSWHVTSILLFPKRTKPFIAGKFKKDTVSPSLVVVARVGLLMLWAIFCIIYCTEAIGAECHLITTSGIFKGTATGPDLITELAVNCNTSYKVALDAGRWFSGSRQLRNNLNETIQYNLWADVNGSVEWGDIGFGGTYAASPVSVEPAGKNTHKVFGSISHGSQQVPSGKYTDSVSITLSWPPYGDKDRKKYTLDLTFSAEEKCNLDISGIHGFGTWPTGAHDLNGVTLGNVNITCTSGIQYALGIDAGQHFDGNHRNLHGDGQAIPYTLRTQKNGREWGDSGLTVFLGDYVETHPGKTVQGEGNGQAQHFFVWGDAGVAGAPAGKYADEVSFTVVW